MSIVRQVGVVGVGDSLGVIIPKAEAEREGLRRGDRVTVVISRPVDLSDIYGIGRGKMKKSARRVKEELRREWRSRDGNLRA